MYEVRPLNPAFYHGASRSERRRIGKELARLREAEDEARALAVRQAGARLNVLDVSTWPHVVADVSPRLLACGTCGQPTPQCVCVGADGQPLDWALGEQPARGQVVTKWPPLYKKALLRPLRRTRRAMG